jgi:hypothetical protein
MQICRLICYAVPHKGNSPARIAVAAELANMPLGGALYRSANLQTDIAPVSQTDAATLLNVSTRTYRQRRKAVERFKSGGLVSYIVGLPRSTHKKHPTCAIR